MIGLPLLPGKFEGAAFGTSVFLTLMEDNDLALGNIPTDLDAVLYTLWGNKFDHGTGRSTFWGLGERDGRPFPLRISQECRHLI